MRILSGVQPSGKIHLGNYFGAIQQFVELQDHPERTEAFYFVADLHALTTIRDAATLREYCHDVALDFLALGLDPAKAALFNQHAIPEVSELNWILSTVTPMALLEKGHSYKDKIANGIRPDHGLFAYPVLMSADILMYRSNLVPVGKDQKQHLEFARDIAVKLNMTYCKDFDPQTGEGGVLVLPDPHILDDTAVVPGTDGRKMSKSYGNDIAVFAPDKKLKKKVMSIVTDSTPLEDPKDWKTCNVYALMKLFMSADELAEQREDYAQGGVGYGHFKLRLLDAIHRQFDEARERRRELEQRPDEVRDVLRDGAARAREVAREVLDDVHAVTGLSGG